MVRNRQLKTIITSCCHSSGIFPADEGKTPVISFDVATTPSFSYWYKEKYIIPMSAPGLSNCSKERTRE
ncbi:MAG: hypothetical protein NT004_01545 [Bacteroidetes bacterium]|nr:hypothetical protein [Bacteroidota bacterium]